MSKIKIQGSASGTGVLTIAAPNTNTDRTITIPDVTGTLLDSGSDLPAANLTGTIADARIPATLPARSGVNLTALNASNLGSGTLPDARFPSTLPAISGANLTNIDAVVTGTSLPSPVSAEGSLFYKTDTDILYVSNGTQWNLVSNASPTTTGGTVTIAALNEGGTFSYNLGIDFTDDVDTDAQLTYTLSSGTLPGGCTLPSSGNTAFTGTASEVGSTSNYTFAISATDTSGSVSTQNYQQTINNVVFSATGGTITTSGSYTIHTFTSSGTLTPNKAGTVEYLVVAGGGGGGDEYYSGGGGAGGYRTATGFAVTATGLTVTVGAGGAGGGSSGNGSAGQGADSVFSTITSIGGGKGGNAWAVGTAGGSGGGGGGSGNENRAGGAGTSGQGYAGGQSCCNYRGGGGGGAGGAGTSSSSSGPSPGGDAATSSISGTSTSYAAGGGGNCHSCSNGMGSKKDGIGGATTHSPTYTQNLSLMDGTANTGSGGSGGDKRASGFSRMGNGGSGIVIIRYLTP